MKLDFRTRDFPDYNNNIEHFCFDTWTRRNSGDELEVADHGWTISKGFLQETRAGCQQAKEWLGARCQSDVQDAQTSDSFPTFFFSARFSSANTLGTARV
jgi:hypothetical protein